MPPKVEFEQIDEHGSMVHSVISYSLSLHGKGCCDPSTIGDYTLSFNRLYFLSCTVFLLFLTMIQYFCLYHLTMNKYVSDTFCLYYYLWLYRHLLIGLFAGDWSSKSCAQ